ncbi:MAG: hypothetical protein FWD61_00230 [Phycisphaerales bacterium]|nr:hypothetical protein [Phycisphaerales bacterium]
MLELDKIRIDGDTQPRVAIDEFVVRQYAADMERGEEFPPVHVMFDGATYWLVDGFHRYHAHKKLAKTQVAAEVATGMQTDAQWESLTANKTHGLRRTNEDKIKAVIKALKLRPRHSDSVIAKHVGVSDKTVTKYRESTSPSQAPKTEHNPSEVRISEPEPSGQAQKPKHNPSEVRKSEPAMKLFSGSDSKSKRIGQDGKRYPTRQRRVKAGISPRAAPVIRGLSKPLEKKTHIEMPLDPEAGAFALVSLLDRSYVEQLVIKLTAILEGRGGTPPALRDLPPGQVVSSSAYQ